MKHPSSIAVSIGLAVAGVMAMTQWRGQDVLASAAASVSGHVVTFGSKPEPVRLARVLLESLSSAEAIASTTTDDGGRFQFVDVAPGRYRLRAGKAGWLEGTFGAVRQGQLGSSFLLAANQQLDLTVRLARGGAIAGAVTNESGDPVANIEVRVFRTVLSRDTGHSSLQSYGQPQSMKTDNDGRYRVYGLPAGDFVVAAVPIANSGAPAGTAPRVLRPGEVDSISGGSPASTLSPRVAYSPVFHPSATGPSEATVIHLQSEEERTGTNIIVRFTPSTEIVGSVSSNLPLAPGSLQVLLGSAREDTLALGTTPAQVDPSGGFVLPQVGPGVYYVLATARELTSRVSASSPVNLYALEKVEASGKRVSLDLSLQPGIEVTGRVPSAPMSTVSFDSAASLPGSIA